MILTVEEKIMSNIMRLYTRNNTQHSISFNNYIYKPQAFLEVVKKCNNAGMIYWLIKNRKIQNLPQSIFKEIEQLYDKARLNNIRVENYLIEAINYIKGLSCRCVVGGSFVVLQEICGEGELFIDEIVLYLEKDVDLSMFSKYIRIKKIIKDKKFFDDNYSSCLLINTAPIDVLYCDAIGSLHKEKTFGEKHIISYLLHDFYITNCRATSFIRVSFQNQMLDSIFQEKMA